MRTWLGAVIVAFGPLATGAFAQVKESEDAMSAMGRRAADARAQIEAQALGAPTVVGSAGARNAGDDEVCQNDRTCPGGLRESADNTQSEMSIAIDSTGQNVVVGFNDFRGFAVSPVSVSGFMYSTDGGQTFTDGGQLPVTTGTSTIGATVLPQVSGDPEVKYLGGCTFVYASIIIIKLPSGGTAQTLGVHRSTDCGKTWVGPFEVAAATNPAGLLTAGGSARDAADKEFMDVDPETGRLLLSWTNFGVGTVQIRTVFSDDGGFTWAAANSRVVAATAADGQASVPRFAKGSTNAYVAWRRFPFPGTLFGYGNTVGFSRSTDNGLTWSAPVDLSPEFLTQDLILGNDRSNTSPSLAVDVSNSRYSGSIYVVYPHNNSQDGSDIAFQRSTDGGLTFSAPILLNARPGADRAQWFPWVTVDDTTGRVAVFYYDQGPATTGDVSEVSYLFSNDGGRTWEHPRPITVRPFHAGHGNDTSQPNLGDYVQAVARGGRTWFAYAIAPPPPLGFTDGQPLASMTVPEPKVTVLSPTQQTARHTPVSLGTVVVSAPGGFADPGERVDLKMALFNYATNPLYARAVTYASASLSTATPGVTFVRGTAVYGSIAAGAAAFQSQDDFEIELSRTFVPGTPIELDVNVASANGASALLHYTLRTGTPVTTTLLTEDFDSTAPGALPAGWATAHGGGANVVPWRTSNTFCGPSNGAFHANANDNPAGSPIRFERLFSPTFVVPSGAEYVTVEFDVCYDTEDDPILPTTAYDGFTLRVTDVTPGRLLRSVLAEAFADELTTGAINHYPKHLPRSSNAAYFQDMSVWAGASNGLQHVRMRLPGMAGSTAQLRFEFTQDSLGTCQDVRPGTPACGVFVDNLVIKSVVSAPGTIAPDTPVIRPTN